MTIQNEFMYIPKVYKPTNEGLCKSNFGYKYLFHKVEGFYESCNFSSVKDNVDGNY